MTTAATNPPDVPTTISPQVLSSTVFAQQAVKILHERDFALGSKDLIGLAYGDCILVLFYAENRESRNIALLWAQAAAQVAGPIFAAVNVLAEPGVAQAFMKLKMDPNHPFHWAALQTIPVILVYRTGFPVAFYNGERNVENFINYSLTLACQADYIEHQQIPAGMQPENDYEITAWKAYNPVLTSSTQFTNVNIRGYEPFPPVVHGSTQEQQEIATITSGATPAGTTPNSPGSIPIVAAPPPISSRAVTPPGSIPIVATPPPTGSRAAIPPGSIPVVNSA